MGIKNNIVLLVATLHCPRKYYTAKDHASHKHKSLKKFYMQHILRINRVYALYKGHYGCRCYKNVIFDLSKSLIFFEDVRCASLMSDLY
jgi:hypothetical protein